jgi:hypothetical protein
MVPSLLDVGEGDIGFVITATCICASDTFREAVPAEGNVPPASAVNVAAMAWASASPVATRSGVDGIVAQPAKTNSANILPIIICKYNLW